MTTQRVFDQPMPSPEEIQAAMRRAHRERSEAFHRLLGALFARRNGSEVERAHTRPGAAACR